ncbi:MAG: hypothetical protein MJZ68_01515 [archaeon]|nr:hypothetical protein [archaeon]
MSDKINNQTQDNEIVVRIRPGFNPPRLSFDIEISDEIVDVLIAHFLAEKAFRSREGKE